MSAVYLHQGEHVSRQRRILVKTRKRCVIARRGCGVDRALLSSLGAVYVADEGHHQVKFMDVGSENRHCHDQDHIRGPPHPKRVSPSSQLILIQSPRPTSSVRGRSTLRRTRTAMTSTSRTRISSPGYLDKCEGPCVKYGRFRPLTASRPFHDG